MKRLINSLGITLMIALSVLVARPVDAQPRVGVSINFQTFYDQLSPYGEWIDYPEYGYTWRPRVGADFRPYSSNGYWMYTNDYDWMWNSSYDWGWAPFHYGRWFEDPYYGWMWVPGYDWSPAWVAWRGGGDYYGWAPLRPGFSISVGFNNYNCPYDYWTFAPGRYMTSRYISRYYHPYRNNVTIINRTTIINNYNGRNSRGRGGAYVNGPRRTDVERYTGRINAVSVRDSRSPGRSSVSRNAVSVYRPAVQRTSSRSSYAPRSVQKYERSNAARSTSRGNVTPRNTTTENRNTVRSRSTQSTRSSKSRVNTAPATRDAVTPSRDGRVSSGRSNSAASNRTVTPSRSGSSTTKPATQTNRSREATPRSRTQATPNSRVQQQQRSRQQPAARQQTQARQQRTVQAKPQPQTRQRSVSSGRSTSQPRVQQRAAPSVQNRTMSSQRSSSGSSRASTSSRSSRSRR